MITDRSHRDYTEYRYPVSEHKRFLRARAAAERDHKGRVIAYNGQQDVESWIQVYYYLCEVPGYKQPSLEERNQQCKCGHTKGVHIKVCTAPGCHCKEFERENWE